MNAAYISVLVQSVNLVHWPLLLLADVLFTLPNLCIFFAPTSRASNSFDFVVNEELIKDRPPIYYQVY